VSVHTHTHTHTCWEVSEGVALTYPPAAFAAVLAVVMFAALSLSPATSLACAAEELGTQSG